MIIMKKKLAAVTMVAAMVVSLCACGSDAAGSSASGSKDGVSITIFNSKVEV